jgi:hypothetical protein
VYGKLFAQMYDGTLGTRGPWEALVTFQQLIILADKHGGVDMTAEAIARRTTIPLEVIKRGLTALQKADPQSRTPDEDGRRIVPLADNRAWGWRIVNYDKYRKIRTADERREYLRQYQRDRRAKLKGARKQNVNKSTADNHKQPIAVSSMVEVEAKAELRSASPLAGEFPNPDHASAYERVRAVCRSGVSFDAGLKAIASGMHGPAYPWATVGQALVEMDAAGAKPSAEAVRGFCRRLANQPKGTNGATGSTRQDRNLAVLDQWLKTENANGNA